MDRIATGLFAGDAGDDDARGPWLLRYVALTAGLALVLIARRPESVQDAQFWAEDNVFFQQQLTLGFWAALGAGYAGFPYVAHRLVALVSAGTPFALTPLAYNAGALIVTALGVATWSLPAFRHLVRRDAVRAAMCVAIACLPASSSLLTTVTELGWSLAIWLVLLAVMRMPRAPVAVGGWSLGGALAVASTPLAPVAVPLWLLRLHHGVRRRRRGDVAFATSQLIALAAVLAVTGTGSAGALRQLPDGSAAGFEWHLADVGRAIMGLGWVAASCLDAAVMPVHVFNRVETHGAFAVAAPALAVAALLLLAWRDLSARGRITLGLAVYLFVASLFVILAGRPGLVRLLHGEILPVQLPTLAIVGVRYRALANVAVLLALAAIVDGACRPRVRWAGVAALAVVAFAWAPELRVARPPGVGWPVWAGRLEHEVASGSREPLIVPSYPPGYEIVLDGVAPAREH